MSLDNFTMETAKLIVWTVEEEFLNKLRKTPSAITEIFLQKPKNYTLKIILSKKCKNKIIQCSDFCFIDYAKIPINLEKELKR